MKPVISSNVAFLPRIFNQLPASLKKTMSKSDVFYILSLEKLYYRKAYANEINETAFLGVVDFICREAHFAGEDFSPADVRQIIWAKSTQMD